MKYAVSVADPKQFANIMAALQIVDQQAELDMELPDWRITVNLAAAFQVTVTLSDGVVNESWYDDNSDILDDRYNEKDCRQRVKELIRLGIVTLLSQQFHQSIPWGILSGVRPTKIFHYLRAKNFSVAQVRERLGRIYGLSDSKANLLVEVGTKQERYFKPADIISVYAGIPFCPTRCLYCSFPAVPMTTHGHLVQGYLAGLDREIECIAELCREWGLTTETIYLGGGTPTSLSERDFYNVVATLGRYFRTQRTVEFTVEAGRPETLSSAKIDTMLEAGVNRISINPQTMNEETLQRIGRNHTVEQVLAAVDLVKGTGLILNMDLILGLPGEDAQDFSTSLQQVLELDPDNVTIHTLAPKRASAWRKNFSKLDLAADAELGRAVSDAHAALHKCGYLPYYLYRQRCILADQENIGFAKPGAESIYNIQMMEERQTIFGLGAGAVTKWVFGTDHQVIRHQNPKCPATYGNRLDKEIVKKAQQTRLLLG